jgi:hypothetical protein
MGPGLFLFLFLYLYSSTLTRAASQSSSQAFQLALATGFRCVDRIRLPQWPGHRDEVTVWRRASPPVDCGGAYFVHTAPCISDTE